MSKPKKNAGIQFSTRPDCAKRERNYRLDNTPVSWQRAKLCGNRFFDGQKADKVHGGLLLLRQHGDEPLFDKACELFIIFYMPISASKKNRKPTINHASAPDIDNLCKYIMDMIRGVLITDDRIFSRLIAAKLYDENPRTEFTIREL